MIVIDDFPQKSEEWFVEKKGKPSASCFEKILTNDRGQPSEQQKEYSYELAYEYISPCFVSGYQNSWMARGNELELEAREAFVWQKKMLVREVAVIYPDEQKKYLCSPDGLVEDGGGLEIKCYKPSTHMMILDTGISLAKKHYAQIQGGMLITGSPHWWYVSYCPGVPLWVEKIPRDEIYISALKNELDGFVTRLYSTIRKIKNARF